jgi:glycosyltransferase involved in cell wall biosynthesis
MNDLVSILIPNYNKAPYLRETLDSIIAQTYPNWECIIIDDHSTDNSWEILEEYAEKDKRFRIYHRPEHLPKGGNAARNYAFKISNGEFIQWFDSDDLMNSDLIQERISNFTYGLDFLVSAGYRFYSVKENSELLLPTSINKIKEGFLGLTPPWYTPSVMFKKRFLIENKLLWDEDLLVLQDVHFNLSVISKSNNFITSNRADWYWRMHSNGKNVGAQRGQIKNLASLRKVLIDFANHVENSSEWNAVRKSAAELTLHTQNRFGYQWKTHILDTIYSIRLLTIFDVFLINTLIFIYYLLKPIFGHCEKIKRISILYVMHRLDKKENF